MLADIAVVHSIVPRAHANNDNDDWSLGVIGGTFRIQPGTSYVRVQSSYQKHAPQDRRS